MHPNYLGSRLSLSVLTDTWFLVSSLIYTFLTTRMSYTTLVRFLVISDTHNYDLDAQPDTIQGFRRQALPKADVLLRRGALTGNGGLEHRKKATSMLSSIDSSFGGGYCSRSRPIMLSL